MENILLAISFLIGMVIFSSIIFYNIDNDIDNSYHEDDFFDDQW